MVRARRFVAIVASLLWAVIPGPAPASPQPAQPAPDTPPGSQAQAPRSGEKGSRDHARELHVQGYTLRYRQANEAIPLIQPLLSDRGTLELQPRGNTLVIRDTASALGRILPILRDYDHPSQPLNLEILIVRASRAVVSPPVVHSDLPEAMTRRLRELFPFEIYEIQAQAQLSTQEGQAVAYDLGETYGVSFRLGTLLDGQRITLSDFEVGRRANRKAAAPLIHGNLSLWLNNPLSLFLGKSEASREMLMIVLTLHRGDHGQRAQR
jgi:hypothetical protein